MYSISIVLAECVAIASGQIIPPNFPDLINFLSSQIQPLTTRGAADTLPTVDMDKITEERLTLRKVRPVAPLNVTFNYTIEPLPPTVTLPNVDFPDASAELKQRREAYMIGRFGRWAEEESRYLQFEEFAHAHMNETLYIPPVNALPSEQK